MTINAAISRMSIDRELEIERQYKAETYKIVNERAIEQINKLIPIAYALWKNNILILEYPTKYVFLKLYSLKFTRHDNSLMYTFLYKIEQVNTYGIIMKAVYIDGENLTYPKKSKEVRK